MNIRNIFIASAVSAIFVAVPARVFAQDYDDIYYTPKSKTETKQKAKTSTKQYTPTPDYPAADTYTPSSYTLTPVTDSQLDAYNRRGVYQDTVGAVSVPVDELGEFEYTRRIERYHNPDVVTNTNDPDLIDYYYSQPSTTSVTNIYVNNPGVYYDPYDYYYGWNNVYRYTSPWYWSTYWSPSWSIGWDPFWGPSWSWSWGSSWGWYPPHHHHHWYPAYHPNHYPGYHPGHHYPNYGHGNNWRPSSPGSNRPHPAAGSASGTTGRRPTTISGTTNWNSSRPGNMGNPGNPSTRPSQGNASSGNYNPGSSRPSATSTPSRGSSSNVTTTTTGRGRNNSGNAASSSSSSRSGSSSSSSTRSRSNSSSGSYSSGNYSSGSRGSYSGGSSRGSSGGGGSSTRGRR